MKIVILPIDERPCNWLYPSLQPVPDEVEIVLPPQNILSHLKNVLDFNLLDQWILQESADADYLILSFDTLAFGGIIPARIHNYSISEVLIRVNVVEQIKKNNPKIKIFANELVERCPAYNDSFEEPNYYSQFGLFINKHGQFLDKKERGILTDIEEKEMEDNLLLIPEIILSDFENRRKINLEVMMRNFQFLKDGTVDFFSIPLDDCAPYGYTQIDIRKINQFIEENDITNILMYPGADEVGLDLLSRCLNDYYQKTPKVYFFYADEKGKKKIPQFEDRAEEITLDLHLKAALCEQVYSKEEADIVCLINCGDGFIFTPLPEKAESMSHRNFNEMLNVLKYAKENNKISAVADVGYINEGDYEFFKYLVKNNALDTIDSYAGWNTNSNTFGTTMSGAVSFFHSGNIEKKNKNLLYRYIEDVLFMSDVRNELIAEVNNNPMPGVSTYNLRLFKERYENFVINYLEKRIKEYSLMKIYDYHSIEVSFPWNRAFEIELSVK